MINQDQDDFFGMNDIDRDSRGRPLIQRLEDGKMMPYTRVSSFASTLDESGGLLAWKSRETAKGVARHEDLAGMIMALQYSDDPDDKIRKAEDRTTNKTLDSYIDTAMGRVDDRAAYGTAIHGLTEKNVMPGLIPDRMRPDIESYYTELKKYGITSQSAEQFVVNDKLGVAGTYDHVYHVPGMGLLIGDKKTGQAHAHKVAIQLACYATGSFYDKQTGARTPLDIRTDVGLLIHIPKGEGATIIYLVNITEGLRAAEASAWVRSWRAKKDLMKVLDTPLLTQ